MSDNYLAAWRAFLEAHAHVTTRLAEDLEAERDLPLTWYDVLVQLSEADDRRLRMTDLADRVLLSKSGLTRLVDRMCAAELVDRCPDPDDRRGRWVEMTERGRARLYDAATVHMRGIADYFTSHLTPDEAAAIESALRRIAAAARPGKSLAT